MSTTTEQGIYSDGSQVEIIGRRGGFTYVTFLNGSNKGITCKVPSSWVTTDEAPTTGESMDANQTAQPAQQPATVHPGRCYCPKFGPGHAPGLHGTWITCTGDQHLAHDAETCLACVAGATDAIEATPADMARAFTENVTTEHPAIIAAAARNRARRAPAPTAPDSPAPAGLIPTIGQIVTGEKLGRRSSGTKFPRRYTVKVTCVDTETGVVSGLWAYSSTFTAGGRYEGCFRGYMNLDLSTVRG